jgi:SRSO17 transposase
VWTTKYHEVAASAMVEAEQVEVKLAELMGHLSVHFSRREPVVQAGMYVRGLLSDLPRKNCWTLAEYAGDATPDRMQRLLERASWDTLAAMGTVRDFVAEHLAGAGGGLAILVLDESGVEKTGIATCGVKRQYVGCAGKVANAVNVVNASYSTDHGHALIGARLYVPVEQIDDPQVRRAMGFRTIWSFGPSRSWAPTCWSTPSPPGAGGLVHRRRGLRP